MSSLKSSGVFRNYYSLLKPRVMYLVVFTAFSGALISRGGLSLSQGLFLGIVSLLCTALGAGAAAALNMWYDSDVDAIMERTRRRAIPSGALERQSALEFGVILALISVLVMAVFVNLLAALVLLASIMFYVYVYTFWLKRRSVQNIVIGGAAGALPPIVGCAAMTNSISVDSVLLFLIIFLWTPPHFWALALTSYDDYSKAGIPMMPCVWGKQRTANQIVYYTAALIVSTWFFSGLGSGGVFYTVTSNILNAKLAYKTFLFYKGELDPYKLFLFSIVYLFSLFTLIMCDNIVTSCVFSSMFAS